LNQQPHLPPCTERPRYLNGVSHTSPSAARKWRIAKAASKKHQGEICAQSLAQIKSRMKKSMAVSKWTPKHGFFPGVRYLKAFLAKTEGEKYHPYLQQPSASECLLVGWSGEGKVGRQPPRSLTLLV